jgi:glycosyltransferase involved in cell wall biosynthesis
MPEISIVLAAHNEGDLLWKTIAACQENCADLDYEIVVADDASEDDCIHRLRNRFPDVAVHAFAERRGTSPAKDLGARHARGNVIVFLDAHCKPELGAIAQLASDIRELDGEAIITPRIVPLDPEQWVNDLSRPGDGYLVELLGIDWNWIKLDRMRPHGRFYESPSLIGCLAVSKRLYEKLWGFDRDMYFWGVENVDFGVKSWLLGHPVLHDPTAVIGHRFQKAFTTYKAPDEHRVANRLRMAYKILPPPLWREWLEQFRPRHSPEQWHRAWDIFTIHRGTAEVERVYLWQRQKLDAVSYARRFGLPWPGPLIEPATTDLGAVSSGREANVPELAASD